MAAAAPRRIRASTPLVHHPLGEGNLDVVLLEGVPDQPASTDLAAAACGAAAPGAGFVVITGGGSELLQACDELKVVVSRHPTCRLSLQSHKWLGLR